MWEVFYSDGSSILSEDATPFSIRQREGVQVIIQESDDHRWKTLSSCDYYVWDDRGKGPKWWGVTDLYALTYYLRKPGYKCVLFGTWIEKEDYNKIFNDAREKWGRKESFSPEELHP